MITFQSDTVVEIVPPDEDFELLTLGDDPSDTVIQIVPPADGVETLSLADEDRPVLVVPGGAGAVSSVNGHDGDVWLTAADVQADAAGAAANALREAKTYAESLFTGGDVGLATAAYVYVQSAPSSEWVIEHNRGSYPSVTVTDTAGQKVEPSIDYPDTNTVIVRAGSPFSGTAYVI
jgi:hypothetical protein